MGRVMFSSAVRHLCCSTAVLLTTAAVADNRAPEVELRDSLRGAALSYYSAADLAAPTAGETKKLWKKRMQELSAMLSDEAAAKEGFDWFRKTYNVQYKDGDQVENDGSQHQLFVQQKFETFRENVKQALKLNIKSDGKAVFGITRFMDLTAGEFRKMYKNGGKTFSDDQIADMMQDVPEAVVPKASLLDSTSATSSRDWRKEGVVTPVKDQGQCGSCWAFSTVETVESAVHLLDKSSGFIGAPQELVSCDHGMDFGCNGGLPTHAYKFLEKNGLEAESDYPYTSGTTKESGTCKMDPKKSEWKVTGYTRVAHGMRIFPWTVSRGEKAMKDYLLNKGPLSIGVDASAWQTYQQGILDAASCESERIDHAVQVVALEQSAAEKNGDAYWVVRNSWTTEWGEAGFIRLTTDENTCLITGMATAATVEKMDSSKDLMSWDQAVYLAKRKVEEELHI
ncbi:unnamed protein product [Amoebophrya sp. A120]|nr:unnamed protein product [Amoebophrya sp. A120]|eukprot:GSA120T00014842001.1